MVASICPEMGMAAPSKLQLALALTVVKQKPPGKDVKDYILEVRSFIKSSKDLGHDVSFDKFFDSVSFWQQAYEHSEERQSKLNDKIHELQQRIEALTAKSRAKDTNDPKFCQTNKRKASAVGKTGASSKVPSKRSKLPNSLKQNHPLIEDEESGDEDALCLSRQLYTLQKATQRRSDTISTFDSLTTAAVVLCKSAEQILILTVQNANTSAGQTSSQPKLEKSVIPSSETVLNGVNMAFHLVHKALQKLTAAKKSEQHQAQIIYYMVGLFESCMTAFTLHCTSTSTRFNDMAKEKSTDTDDEFTSRLADLLCTMALSLDLTRSEDQQVLEGFLYLVLHRIGRMLALHVFHDIRLPMGVCPGMEFPEGLEAMTDEGLMPKGAQMETRYLVRLLGKMLDFESSRSQQALAAHHFLSNAKDRMQKTLLRSVFGPDDYMFREVLQRPQTPPPLDTSPAEQEQFADWLTQELWRLVGWDILKTVFSPK